MNSNIIFDEVDPTPPNELFENVSVETQQNTILSLRGVGPATFQKLIDSGYDSVLAIASTTPRLLASKCDIPEKTASTIIADARAQSNLGSFEKATTLLESRKLIKRIPTGLKKFDKFLKGGFESQAIAEFYGEFGSGKSQFCFFMCFNLAKSLIQNSEEGVIVYIDTENTFRPERIETFAIKNKVDPTKLLERIYILRAYSSGMQLLAPEKIKKLSYEYKIKLIVVDSISAHFRAEYIGRGFLSERQQLLNSHLKDLMNLAIKYNCLVLITNQVQSNPDMYGEKVKPVGGNVLAHSSTYRIFLKKRSGNKRVLKIVDSPDYPDDEFKYSLGEKGIIEE